MRPSAERRFPVRLLALGLLVLGLAGCDDGESSAAVPMPAALDREAIGYYCNMIVADHQGPKGQAFVRGRDEPYWFSSVRDAFAFTMLPDEPKSITALYVNDMGRATWESPESDTWIEARGGWFVVGSDRVGGMGAPEIVPFASGDAAEAFAGTHGGEVMRFAEVPQGAVLGSVAAVAHGAHGTMQ